MIEKVPEKWLKPVGIKRWIATKRRIVQTASLLALHSAWVGEVKWFCNPVLSCHSCALSWFACPVGVFIHYSAYRVFPLLAIGTVLLLGILLGRLLCGWVCPFGFLQDLLYRIRSPKFILPGWTSYIKYAVLILMVLMIPFILGENTMLSFCRVCPASALQVTIPNLISGQTTTISVAMMVKLAFLVIVLLAAVVSSRSFCKVLCPIGAFLAPLNLLSFWEIKPPHGECGLCEKCDRVCPNYGLPSARLGQGRAPNRILDCVVCHDCQAACPLRKREEKKKD